MHHHWEVLSFAMWVDSWLVGWDLTSSFSIIRLYRAKKIIIKLIGWYRQEIFKKMLRFGIYNNTWSHTRTAVRECFKGDEASQWKRPKFDPSPHQNPLTDLHQKLAGVITSWTAPGMQNFVAIGSGVSAPQIHDFAVHLGWLGFSSFFGFFNKATRTPLNGFLCKIRQKTSFQVKKCLLGVSITIFDI